MRSHDETIAFYHNELELLRAQLTRAERALPLLKEARGYIGPFVMIAGSCEFLIARIDRVLAEYDRPTPPTSPPPAEPQE